MLDPQPTLSELDRKLGPVLGKQIDGIEDLRKLMSESEEDVSEPRREKNNNEWGERREGVLPRPPRPAPFGSTTRSPIRCSCLCLSRAPGKKSKVPSSPVPALWKDLLLP